MARPTTSDEGPKPFSRFIQVLGDGDCHAQLTEALHELGKELHDRALADNRDVKGELRLKIPIVATPTGLVMTTYEIDTKRPKPLRPKSAMWVDENGNFVDRDPRQPQLPGLREVPAAARSRVIDVQPEPVKEA